VHRSSGFASVELSVPIGARTSFRIASASKQFTCAASLMLAADGKLRSEDHIRDRLPQLPDLGQRITRDHLMRNTSGIRDMLDEDDGVDPARIPKVIEHRSRMSQRFSVRKAISERVRHVTGRRA
jgi:CubicO group peptidase (beta-lactamase class C family)